MFPEDSAGLVKIPQGAFDLRATRLLPYIPLGNIDPATDDFSDASQKKTANDNKYGHRRTAEDDGGLEPGAPRQKHRGRDE